MRDRNGDHVGPDFYEIHENCEAPWECMCCGRLVCPRCDPSPAEFERCVECAWFSGDVA